MVRPATYVTVHDDDGESHTFSPADDLPRWAVKKITNPNVLPKNEDGAPTTGSIPTADGTARARQ